MFKLLPEEELEVDEGFVEEFKRILLAAARKHFGKNVRFNSDERIVNAIIKGLLRNMVQHGHMYCPCRVEKIREHICPCEPAKGEIEENGICHCRLFVYERGGDKD